jgi:hypothetical protein
MEYYDAPLSAYAAETAAAAAGYDDRKHSPEAHVWARPNGDAAWAVTEGFV